jgi:hypothetical protein
MTPLLVTAVIFYALYMVIKNFTDYSLKKMIIKSGNPDIAGVLNQKVSPAGDENREINRYPSLKWGLVAFCAGMGFIFIDANGPGTGDYGAQHRYMESLLPIGIEMVCISFGFILYFIIVNIFRKK